VQADRLVYVNAIYVDAIKIANWAIFKPHTEHDNRGSSSLSSRRFLVSVIAAAVMLLASFAAPLAGAAAPPAGFAFSAAGDYGSWGGLRESLAQLEVSKSNFVLALGDLSYGGNTGYANSTEEAWCERFQKSFRDVEIIAGNHDTGQPPLGEGDINNYTKYCPFTLASKVVGEYGKQYYFDYPAANPMARFILISPDLLFVVDGGEHYDYHVNTPRYNWTRDAIDSARAANMPWVIVAMHKPCISVGEHSCETGTDILNLLLDKKVDLILQAHNHNYERSKQLVLNPSTCAAIQEHVYNANCIAPNDASSIGQYQQGAGSVIVVAGVGGREIIEFDPTSHDAPYFAAWMGNNTAGYGNGVVNFNVDADHITMHTSFNGTYTDTFTISKASTDSVIDLIIGYLPFIVIAAVGVGGAIVWARRRARRKADEG
jgi:ABC-type amino acid transport substrate-binding protein